jgi:hypothetical protein
LTNQNGESCITSISNNTSAGDWKLSSIYKAVPDIDMYSQGGLPALCKPVKYHRKQKLDEQKKQELKKMLLEQKPTD